MLPAAIYTPLYHHVMLVVVICCALFYLQDQRQAGGLSVINQTLMVFIGLCVVFFIGFRPISGVFIDMVTYAWDYDVVQHGGEGGYNDGLFKWLMRVCAPVLPAKGFFFVCACLYIVPLAIAGWRVHGTWAFPMFLTCITAFSFWAYGVNGIRNGMATSILVLAFAFYDVVPVMLGLMVVAWGIHGSVLLPGAAFMVVWYFKKTELWLGFWLLCVAASIVAGNVGDSLLSRFNPVSWDDRASSYIHSVGSGFRLDFLAYSIVPILLTMYFSAQGRTYAGQRARNSPAASLQYPDPAVVPSRRIGMGLRGGGRLGRGIARSAVVSSSNLGEPSRRILRRPVSGGRQKSGISSSSQACVGIGNEREQGLTIIRMLRSDPFYVRLVNTYLMANGFWVLVINTSFSNRFAYLSWFLMPWILIYPFVPGKFIRTPRNGAIATVLFAHYMFTYVMVILVYRLRGTL